MVSQYERSRVSSTTSPIHDSEGQTESNIVTVPMRLGSPRVQIKPKSRNQPVMLLKPNGERSLAPLPDWASMHRTPSQNEKAVERLAKRSITEQVVTNVEDLLRRQSGYTQATEQGGEDTERMLQQQRQATRDALDRICEDMMDLERGPLPVQDLPKVPVLDMSFLTAPNKAEEKKRALYEDSRAPVRVVLPGADPDAIARSTYKHLLKFPNLRPYESSTTNSQPARFAAPPPPAKILAPQWTAPTYSPPLIRADSAGADLPLMEFACTDPLCILPGGIFARTSDIHVELNSDARDHRQTRAVPLKTIVSRYLLLEKDYERKKSENSKLRNQLWYLYATRDDIVQKLDEMKHSGLSTYMMNS